jgi:anion-transporting  ArsA/GET3 family ATPase
MGLLSRQLARSGIVELVATTAPGLDDLLVLGRIKAFEKEDRADLIVIDGPAAGHATDFVRAPIQLKRAISTGPIGQQADEVLDMLADPTRCRLMLVTTPAMTPVSETLDVADEISSTVNITLTPMVINKVDATVPDLNTVPDEPYLAEALAYSTQRSKAQQQAVGLLRQARPEELLVLPRENSTGAALVESLAATLAVRIEELP